MGGFIFDIVTLKRVDLFLENLWVLGHLILAAICIIILNFHTRRTKVEGVLHFWMLILIQFSFGGLLSTFLVFYFRSATLSLSWPFLLILAIVFVCNESFKHHYSRLSFQITVLYVSTYSFAIFYVPVLIHRIGDDVFVLSGAVSLVAIGIFIYLLRFITREQFIKSKYILVACIGGVTILVNVLYFYDIIPPIPLSLKDSGVYHSISRNASYEYVLSTEQPPHWWDFIRGEEVIHTTPGAMVYVWSAIFSPTNLNTHVYHVWQHYDEATKKWIAGRKIELLIVGGRDNGYRTYSQSNAVTEGRWRVDVETATGQSIGRISFTVKKAIDEPELFIEKK